MHALLFLVGIIVNVLLLLGSEQLKEWVSLEAKDGNMPKVRIPHPMTTMLLEGTRKRRRAAVKDHTWSVGDRVDAWVRDWYAPLLLYLSSSILWLSTFIYFPTHLLISTIGY